MNEELCTRLISPKIGIGLQREQDTLVDAKGHRFPIINGIPRFVDGSNYAQAFGIQWNEFAKTQLDSYTGLRISEDRLTRCMRGELPLVRGKRVFEAGSGAGRFTEVLLKHGAILDSFDFSSAVEANALNNGAHSNLTLVQTDVRTPPFPARSYDYVICLVVVQHTPSPEQTIEALYEMVAPGGALIFDHYDRRLGDCTTLAPFWRVVIKRLPLKYQRKARQRRRLVVSTPLEVQGQYLDTASPATLFACSFLLSKPSFAHARLCARAMSFCSGLAWIRTTRRRTISTIAGRSGKYGGHSKG